MKALVLSKTLNSDVTGVAIASKAITIALSSTGFKNLLINN